MGIANPVTRASAGSLYHQELARQLAEFLRRGDPGILRQRGGMVTLHDAFCLFNRCVSGRVSSCPQLKCASNSSSDPLNAC